VKRLFQIVENINVQSGFFQLRVKGHNMGEVWPGQFVMIRLPGQAEPILRRPFSICRYHKDGFEVLYQVKGVFTEKLSNCKPNDLLDVMGPLGNGFSLRIAPLYIVAGGIGVAPFVFFVENLIRDRFNLEDVEFFLGAKTQNDLLMIEFLSKLGVKIHISTDDGSIGEKGLILDLVRNRSEIRFPMAIVACGPEKMLKAVAAFCEKKQIRCEVSMEAYMACGIGACLGCAIRSKVHPEKFNHVCQDGPVFDATHLYW